MHESFSTSSATDKESMYSALGKSAASLLGAETNPIANMANFCALVHHAFEHHWTGVYLVQDGQLVLGPFQGPVACTRIEHGKGVCGAAWAEGRTMNVPDVNAFPGHIACSVASKSELVIPLKTDRGIIGVLDIDSVHENQFDELDEREMEKLVQTLVKHI